MGAYRFRGHGGAVVAEGKVVWPDDLRLEMERWIAWTLVRDLLVQLQAGDDTILWTTVGQVRLVPAEEDGS